MRALTLTYQAFYSYDAQHIRALGLTIPQFDVIATLGNTEGMFMHELAQKTLVTKGTLTGIVDRLEKKDYVRREIPQDNRRCFRIVLTSKGKDLFERIFPENIAYLKQCFDQLSSAELDEIKVALDKLRSIFPTQSPQ
jgi:DNA-binding MarR family transcriptional regulator